jgi:hypothetical protein
MRELTVKEERYAEDIRETVRRAKSAAERQILDALCVVESQLRMIRLGLCPSHDGKVGDSGAVQVGIAAVQSLLDVWPDLIPMECYRIIEESKVGTVAESDSFPGPDDEYMVDDLRRHVDEFFERMKVTR